VFRIACTGIYDITLTAGTYGDWTHLAEIVSTDDPARLEVCVNDNPNNKLVALVRPFYGGSVMYARGVLSLAAGDVVAVYSKGQLPDKTVTIQEYGVTMVKIS
jgi:hypothetical protein